MLGARVRRCKGVCRGHKGHANTPHYTKGHVFCAYCSWAYSGLPLASTHCPCCGKPLRHVPRNSGYKARHRELLDGRKLVGMDDRSHRRLLTNRAAIANTRDRLARAVDAAVLAVVDEAREGRITRDQAVSELEWVRGAVGLPLDGILRRAAARLPTMGTGAMAW